MATPVVFTGWQLIVLHAVTLICSSACVIVPFVVISRNQTLLEYFTRGDMAYLKSLTVIIVVWSATTLAVEERLTEGPSAILGIVVGYVFGAVGPGKRPTPPIPPSDPSSP